MRNYFQSAGRANVLFVLLLIVIACVSCRLVNTLSGGEKPANVDALWTDVPPFPGATKTDTELPLATRLVIRAAMQGKVSFIAFTTDKNAQDVQDYYTKDRMKAAGWNASAQGCTGDRDDKKSQGAVCFFDRQDGKKKEGLAIVLAQDEKSKQTDIFYARIDMTDMDKTPTPTP